MTLGTASRVINIYCCFNYADERGWQELKSHLRILERSGTVKIGDFNTIRSGFDMKHEQITQLSAADIILLFLSHHFIDDNPCWEIMLQAMQRHRTGEARVVPILFSPVLHDNAIYTILEMLPKKGKPLPITRWKDRNEAHENVARGIYKIIEEIMAK